MATLSHDKKHVNFNFGGSLESHQIKSICTGNAGATATNEQINAYLLEEGWLQNEIDEFLQFINSKLVKKLKF